MQTFVKLPRALLHHLGKEDTSKPWERLHGGLGLKNTLDLTDIRLLTVRLFSLNPFSSCLIQRDCKPRRYFYNKGLRADDNFFFSGLRPRFSRLPALPLECLGFACSSFANKNKRLLAV